MAPVILYDGPEVKTLGRVVPWAREVLRRATKVMPPADDKDIYVTHGDTFSTLVAIYLGRQRHGRIAHVESGLRSFNLLNPFPEELVRRIAIRYSDIAFAPGKWAAENLAASRGRVVDTVANTLLDTVRFALEKFRVDTPERKRQGVLFSIHRFETLYSRSRTQSVIDFVRLLANRTPVTFVLHPSTETRFLKLGLLRKLESMPGVTLLPRMTYLPFISIALSSQLVVTDGGSNQEELSYIGIPTILMRAATERQEGLGSNVLLGDFDFERMERFADVALTQVVSSTVTLPDIHPSSQIAHYLLAD